MARLDDIVAEAKKLFPRKGYTRNAFIRGCLWADEHPAEPMPRQCFEYPTEEVIKDIQETFRMDSEQFLIAETERSRRAKEAYNKQLNNEQEDNSDRKPCAGSTKAD